MIRRNLLIQVDESYLEYLAGSADADGVLREVAMVLPRPGHRVLTSSKYYYPTEVFRLPTGKVRALESPEDAFLRETWEETGLRLSEGLQIAEITHHCVNNAGRVDVRTYVFIGPMTSAKPYPADDKERINGYREVDVAHLPLLKDRLLGLFGKWQGFGRLRAPAHQVVFEYLSNSRGLPH